MLLERVDGAPHQAKPKRGERLPVRALSLFPQPLAGCAHPARSGAPGRAVQEAHGCPGGSAVAHQRGELPPLPE